MPETVDEKIVKGRQINDVNDLVRQLDSEDVTGFLVCVTIERKNEEKYTQTHRVVPYSWPAKSVLDSVKAYRKLYVDDLTGGK